MASKLTVCLLSPHPLVLAEFERLLSKASQFKVISKQLESTLAPDLRNLEPPRAQVYVIDAHAARQATGALLTNILERYADARLLVVGDSLNEGNSFSLLRLGVKGILTYAEARDQLSRALPLVSQGGFWVPRSVLSGFVDSILTSQGRRLKTDSVANLSRKDGEGSLSRSDGHKFVCSLPHTRSPGRERSPDDASSANPTSLCSPDALSVVTL